MTITHIDRHDPAHYQAEWSLDLLTARRYQLYLARLAHIRQRMLRANVPVLLILDPNNIFYMTGARNMQLWALRSPSRYLLAFQSGPNILFDFKGGEHLSEHLPTIDMVKQRLA